MLVWQPGVRVGIGWALSTVLLVSTMSLRLFAQPPASRGPVFAARSDLVLIPMHVTDRAGKTITDLRSDQFEVAGFKGQALTFRSWDQQLRQPVLLAQALMVVSLSPQEGFLHQKFLTDTLGFDEPETKCVLAP